MDAKSGESDNREVNTISQQNSSSLEHYHHNSHFTIIES